jgi:hypothetical protein
MLLRLFVKINVLVVSALVHSIASNNGYSYAPSIFGIRKNWWSCVIVVDHCRFLNLQCCRCHLGGGEDT